MSTPANTPRRKAVSVYLPPSLAERLERVRARYSVGSAAPPLAALVVCAVEHGLDRLETAPPAETAA